MFVVCCWWLDTVFTENDGVQLLLNGVYVLKVIDAVCGNGTALPSTIGWGCEYIHGLRGSNVVVFVNSMAGLFSVLIKLRPWPLTVWVVSCETDSNYWNLRQFSASWGWVFERWRFKHCICFCQSVERSFSLPDEGWILIWLASLVDSCALEVLRVLFCWLELAFLPVMFAVEASVLVAEVLRLWSWLYLLLFRLIRCWLNFLTVLECELPVEAFISTCRFSVNGGSSCNSSFYKRCNKSAK